jgi:putative ABC transport system permease protein
MNIFELIIESMGTLTLNKMRTGLAILGIVIGIGSVIALISLGQASQKQIESQIQSLGSNLLTVSPGAQQSGGVRSAAGSATTLTLDDAKAIQNSSDITTIKTVSPEVSSRKQVTAGRNNTNTQIIGATPAYLDVHKVQIASGNFISQRDADAMTKVAVLGPTTAANLFPELANPIGQKIRINGQILTVIGLTVSKGGTGFLNQDDSVYVPLLTAQKQLFGLSNLTSIALEAKSQDVMTQAQNEVGYLLLARHKLNDPSQADFSIFSQINHLNSTSSGSTRSRWPRSCRS